LIAIPLALLVIFDLPGLGILLAIGLLGYAYVAKKNHEAAPAGHRQPLVMSGPEHHNRAASARCRSFTARRTVAGWRRSASCVSDSKMEGRFRAISR
jgi:hypothetical protein